MTFLNSRIEICEYDPSWAKAFRDYAFTLQSVLGQLAMSIEHIGSTSVVGLAAKPIIDIDIAISSRLLLQETIAQLAKLNYTHQGNLEIPGREAFIQPQGTKQHHLYVCSVDTPNLHNHLIFRDYLRTHPDTVQEYGNLKKQLVQECGGDRNAYTMAKTEFIESILAKADAEYGFHTLQPQLAQPSRSQDTDNQPQA
ncbi:MAG: GrpB family protein [Cyanobacteria bacterium P01_E01_bin.42]